jgi:bifunctional enzyme CysN/CysC/sulfate adenylyltransferase subunit 1
MLSTHGRERPEGFAEFLDGDLNKELLRFTTAGSVDDGKSTLIGRLLHDSKSVYEDQLASVKNSRINRSSGPVDFSLLTDGLRAEREQGITIDVAYRYFSTPRRKFIIADTPGHEQYTRNMATGASTADLAVILIDATKGLLAQTRRHSYIASLLGIRNLLAAINKMDLVDYREDVFLRLQADFLALADRLDIRGVQCVPVSALSGDNVVARSEKMPWYSGPTLLEHLETVDMRRSAGMDEVRFPIQYVIRPDASFRGFAGQIASGTVRPGHAVLALPSGQKTHIQSIVTYDGDLREAGPSMSVTLTLEDEIDLSRGDMLVSVANPPQVSAFFTAMVVWLHRAPLQTEQTYLIKHAGRQIKAKAKRIVHRMDVNTLTEQPAAQLAMNEIAEVEFEASGPLFFDSYDRNRITGSFILIDALSNATVGAAMIRDDWSSLVGVEEDQANVPEPEIVEVDHQERHRRHGHGPALFLFGSSSAIARGFERLLFAGGFEVLLVDGAKVPKSAAFAVLDALWAAGLLVLYSGEVIPPEERVRLAAFQGNCVFDFTGAELPENDAATAKEILAIAESLRIQAPMRDRKAD